LQLDVQVLSQQETSAFQTSWLLVGQNGFKLPGASTLSRQSEHGWHCSAIQTFPLTQSPVEVQFSGQPVGMQLKGLQSTGVCGAQTPEAHV
jgi:hypothetical protein